MKKHSGILKIFTALIFLAFLSPFSVVKAQTQPAYIIVHALNPEGVEIASIDGVDPYAVEIFDGSAFIGYGAYNSATHCQPIPITAGSHTIKAKFNGMTMEQNITAAEGETRVLTFTFTRTTYDLWDKVPASDSSTALVSGSWIGSTPRYVDNKQIFGPGWSSSVHFEEFYDGGYDDEGHYIQSMGNYNGVAVMNWIKGDNLLNYSFHTEYTINWNVTPSRPFGSPAYSSNIVGSISYNPISLSLYSNSFSRWYLQYTNYTADLFIQIGNAMLLNGDYLLLEVPSENSQIVITSFDIATHGFSPDPKDKNGGGSINLTLFSSVPYDILGTGIKDEIIETPSIPLTKQVPQDKTTTVGEPINVANGNMFTTASDILIPSNRLPLELSRTYNSQDDFQGSFGYGWRSNFDIILTEYTDGTVIEVDENGTYTIYTKNPDGTYSASAGKYSQLTKNPDGSYQILRKHGAKLYFNAQGLLTRIEDRNANAITILRDSNGLIQEADDASGRKLLFSADPQGKITQVTDPANRLFKYEYDSNGNLTKVTGSLNNATTYSYDSSHNLTQLTDSNNHSLYFEYDSKDRAYHSWQDNNNNEVTLSFDPANKTTTSTDSLGNVTTYEYNDYGLVTKITDSQANTQLFNWDSQLNKTLIQNQNGFTTAFTYDARGNLLTVTGPLSNTTNFTYEPNFDFIVSTTDALGNRAEYSYDSNGNLLQLKDALNNITNYTYSQGLLTQILDANNNLTLFDYDSFGNLVQITDTQNNKTLFSYDILGNKTQTTDAQGNVTNFTYDLLSRLTQITYPDNSKVTYTYDAVGNLISSVDQNNNTTSYAYDVVDRLTQLTDAQGNLTTYTYDTEGNRTSITDAAGNITQYFYDSLNRLIKIQDTLNNQTLFSYDAVGNLTSKTDANGNVVYYTYDALNRLLEKGLSPQGTVPKSVVSYTYDVRGSMLTAVNFNISYNFTYDSLGQLLSVTDSNNRSISYTYDAVGNKTKMTTPEAKTVSYSYDSLNRLTSILDTYNKTTTYSYDSLSRRTKVTLPNQTQTSYSYDALNNLLSLANKTQSSLVISSYIYTYDKAGNRLTKTEPNLKTSYTYDVLYRLTQSIPVKIKDNGKEKEKKNGLETFTYDPVGNRLTSKKDTYSYNSLNQLLSTKDYSYEYDANGNLIKKTETDEKDAKQKNYTFTYDYENRLTKVEIQKENKLKVVTFTYDPFNRRISKTVQKEEIENEETEFDSEDNPEEKALPRTTYYLYDSEDIILEYNQKGKITARYTHGPGIDEPISIERNNKLYYYHYDGLGSVTELTDQKGKTAESYSYDSFGNLKRQGNKSRNTFTYTAREYDRETGLYYYRARYYDPKIGRFLQRDPVGYYDSMNLYLYVQNNPLNYFDPFGEDAYYINNKFNTSTPTNSPISHSFVAITDKDPVTGKEKVVKTFSWVDTKGGMWEDPLKQQNIEGAQKAIDIGVGVEKRGDETLDKYVEDLFEKRKGQKGGFYMYRGWCKVQANRLIDDAIKRKAKDAAKKGKIL